MSPERTAIGMAVVLLAAASGITGNGPLAGAVLDADGLRLRYQRIARLHQAIPLRWTVATDRVDTVTLDLDLEGFDETARTLIPHGVTVRSLAGGGIRFLIPPSATDSVMLRSAVTPQRAGRMELRIRRASGDWLTRPLFVLP